MKKPSQAPNMLPNQKHSLLWILYIFVLAPAICQASTVATPTFSPAAGTYTSIQTVTISDTTSGATIYYTTNGSTPTTSSAQYTSPITVSSTKTVKAIGTKTGFTQSAVGSAAYTINLTVTTPSFSPAAGTYNSTQTVTISDATSGAMIYYTTNGSTPTTSSTQYTGPITVSSSETVKAIATATGYSQSAVGSAAYTITTLPTLIQSTSTGLSASSSTITLSGIVAGHALYIGVWNGNGFSETITFTDSMGATWTTPSFSLHTAANLVGDGDTMAVGCAIAPSSGSDTVTVLVNGTAPLYNNGAILYEYANSNCTLDVTPVSSNTLSPTACTSGLLTTATANDLLLGFCEVAPASSSTFSPGSGWSNGITVGLSGMQAALGETQLGSTVTNYTASSSTFTASEQTTILAAWRQLSGPPPAQAPVITPPTGTYSSAQTVSMTDSTSGATIYYTTNGSTPTTSSTQYTGPITVSSSETVNAFATATGYSQSAVGSAAYTITTLPTLIQSTSTGLSASSSAITLSGIVAGHALYIGVGNGNGFSETITFTDSMGATWTTPSFSLHTAANLVGDGDTMAVGCAIAPSSGSDTVTVLVNGTAPLYNNVAILYEYANSNCTLDVTPVSSNTLSPTACTSGLLTTATANDLLLGFCGVAASSSTFSPGSGWSNGITAGVSGIQAALGETQLGSTVTNYTATSSTFTASEQTTILAAWRQLSGPPPAQAPVITPPTGTYSSAQTVSMTDSTSGATIYYTTDGSTPTTSSTQYTGPITVSSSETVNAIATASGYSQSAVGSAAYTIGVPQIPSFVQGNTTGATGSASTLAYTNNVTAGDALYCFSFDGSGANHSNGCADSQGNTWNTVASVSLGTAHDTVTLACAIAGTSGPNTVTFNVNGATTAVVGGIYQIHNSTCTLDGTPAKSNTTGASACNSSSLATSTVNDLLLGVCGAAVSTMEPGSGWSDALTIGGAGYILALGELQVSSTTGSYTATSSTFPSNAEQATLEAAFLPTYGAPPAATPTFSPAAGTYTSTQTVTIGDTTSGATIYYTTNGSTPTTSSTEYTAPITVPSSETLNAIATATGYSQSAVGSATYTINSSSSNACGETAQSDIDWDNAGFGMGTPCITGTNAGGYTVSSISYWVGSSTPTSFDLGVYSDSSGSPGSLLCHASTGTIMPSSGWNSVDISSCPALNPSTAYWVGYVNGSDQIEQGTVSGSCPGTSNDTVFTNSRLSSVSLANPFGANFSASACYSMYMSLNAATAQQAATPTFSPAAGTYTGTQTVTISDATSGATIYYTTNGVTPTTSSTQYTSAITVSSSETVEAIAAATGYSQSAVGSAAYTITPPAATPTFSPAAGTYGTIQIVTISDTTSGATVYYTTNGTTPTISSSVYSGPITVSSTETLEAVAIAAGSTQSGVAVATYTINTLPPAAAPKFTPVTGTYSGPQAVSVADSTSGTTIYYTTNGTTPTTSSSVYSGPITVSSTKTIKALATASGYDQSPITTANYTIANGPTITGISPVVGPIGTSVTISGGSFGTSGTVTFNGLNGIPTSWGDQTITVPVPAGASTGPIVVTTSQGTSNSKIFAVGSGISGISPTAGSVGTSVTISGSGFGATQGSSVVTFDGVPATPSSWSDSSIAVAVPSAAKTGNVAVLLNGTSVTGPVFTLAPSIASLSPSSGPIGTIVTISGSDLGGIQGNSAVAFGQTTAAPTQWSQNTIVVPVPAAAVSGPVVVTVAGQSSNAVSFAVGAAVTGSISGTVTQSDGVTPVVGASITVFEGTNAVATAMTGTNGTYSVGNLAAATYNLQASSSGFGTGQQSDIPVTAGQVTTANIALTNQRTISYTYDKNGRLTTVADSASGSSATYAYDPVGNITSITRSGTAQLSVLGFSPYSGPVGTAVTVTGTGFASIPEQNSVTIDGASASVVSGTPTQLIVTVPSGATTGPVNVTNTNGSATSGTSFIVTTAGGVNGPTITSFTPGVVSVGATVTISGTGFSSNPTQDTVAINGFIALVGSATATSISVTVPPNATSGPISVQTASGRAVSSSPLAIVPTEFAIDDGYQPNMVDFTGQLTLGQSYTGMIHTAGDIGIVTFTANAGQVINVGATNSTISTARVDVLAPDGTDVGGVGIITPAYNSLLFGGGLLPGEFARAPQTGTYTVLISATGSTGTLTITLSTNPATVAITPAVATNISIGTPGQGATFSFSGTAGQWVSYQISNLSTPCSFTYIYLLSPGGTTLYRGGTANANSNGAQCSASSFNGPVQLPATGTYTLQVDPEDASTWTASLTVTLASALAPVSITPGTPAALTINTPGQSAQFTFSGALGQTATVQLSNSNYPDRTSIQVLDPNGNNIGGGIVSDNGSIGPIPLPANGTYMIVVAPQNGDTGSSTITLTLAQQTGVITPGTPANVTISTAGQSAQLTFFADPGQFASVALSQSTFSSQMSISIVADGITWDSATGNLLGPFFTSNGGFYTLVVTPVGGGTGSVTVSLSLSSIQAGGPISPGVLTPVTFSSSPQSIQFSFTGSAGQLASVLIPNSPFPDGVSIDIEGPDGESVDDSGAFYFLGPVALPVNGTYTVTITPQNGDTGTADVLLTLSNNQAAPTITPAAPVPVNIGIPGQSAQLSFHGAAGQSASVRLSNISITDYVTMSMINPDGTTLIQTYNSNFNDDFQTAYSLESVALPATGTYTVVISPQNGSTGGATVTLSLQ